MADRFPLIANSSSNQIQELASGDRLDLTGTDVVNLKAAGVVTATSFDGSATGLSGSPDITINNIVGVAATFSGTLSYEDVTNIDAIGIVTAQSGLRVVGGGITATGVGTFHSGVSFNDLLREEVNITAGKLSDNTNIDLENGMVHLFTTTETTTSTPNIRYSSSESLDSKMSVGQSVVVTLITTAAAGAYSANITIDGSAVTENWIGGSAPDAGGSSGVDIHTFTIIKTASATFTVIGNHSTTS